MASECRRLNTCIDRAIKFGEESLRKRLKVKIQAGSKKFFQKRRHDILGTFSHT